MAQKQHCIEKSTASFKTVCKMYVGEGEKKVRTSSSAILDNYLLVTELAYFLLCFDSLTACTFLYDGEGRRRKHIL